jgi:predicted RNA binding protein YcfA (HicA-like mRNA interferase family)
MKVSAVLSMLTADGWQLVATKGSHRQFKHTTKSGRVTVPGKPGDDLAPGTLNSILKQAGLKDGGHDAVRRRHRKGRA